MHKIIVLFLRISSTFFSQLKIGDNPSIINSNSILELENTNALTIEGLELFTENSENEIIVVDKAIGILKKIETSNLLREDEIIVIATDG